MIKKKILKIKPEAKTESVLVLNLENEKKSAGKVAMVFGTVLLFIAACGYIAADQSRTRQAVSIISHYVIDRVIKTDYDELKYDLRTSGNEIAVIDLRPEFEYVQGHLFGEVANIPFYGNPQEKWKTKVATNAFITSVEAAAKHKKKVILYGDYADDGIVSEAAVLLLMRGINARVLSIGWKEWSLYYGSLRQDGSSLLRDVPMLPIPKQ